MDINAQRRLLAVGGVIWIATGSLGVIANNLLDGMNKLMIYGPFLVGIVLLGIAVRGFGQNDQVQSDQGHDHEAEPIPVLTREKHA